MEDDRVPHIYASAGTTNHNCSVGIGCMSSKRKGITTKKKKLDGWFVKLMCGSKVIDPQTLQDKSTSTRSPKSTGSSEKKEKRQALKSNASPSTKEGCQHQLESFTVVIKRGPSGFGFSIDGMSPAFISKVESGSAAATAGLKKGDCVMRYNGQNVSRLSARELKSIILRSGLQRIILDIQRGEMHNNDENKENKVTVKPALPSHITCEMHDELSNFSGSSSFAALKRGSFTEVPTMNSAQLSADNYTYDSQGITDNAECITEIKESTRITQDLPNETQDHQSAIKKLLKLEKQFVQQMSLGVQQYSRPLRHCVISNKQHQSLFQNVEKLVAVSEFHVRQLNERSATYSDVQWGGTYGGSPKSIIDTVGSIYLPRIKILSDSYLTYMQGLDNAKNLLSELKGYPEFNMFLQTSDEVFTEMSIDDFIDTPCLYLRSLHEHLKAVASNTPSHHHDHFPIHQVLHEMNTSMVRIYQIRNKLSKKHSSGASILSGSSGYSGSSGISRTSAYSALSGLSRSSAFSRTSGMSKGSGCSRASDYMGSSGLSRSSDASMESTFLSKLSADETLARGGSSVAVDALSFQQRLSFPPNIQKSKFLPLMRHLIYCGELMWKSPDSQWTTVCAALFSELLVLTRLDTSGKLNVIREPLPLSQVTHLSFLSPHPSEFKVRSMVGEKSMELRAKTLEQKCVWKNLLEQRLAAVRTSSLERVQKQKTLKSKLTDNRL